MPFVNSGDSVHALTASKDMTSGSVELCETAVCLLHVQRIGTKDRHRKHKIPPDVDLESSRSLAKSVS